MAEIDPLTVFGYHLFSSFEKGLPIPRLHVQRTKSPSGLLLQNISISLSHTLASHPGDLLLLAHACLAPGYHPMYTGAHFHGKGIFTGTEGVIVP